MMTTSTSAFTKTPERKDKRFAVSKVIPRDFKVFVLWVFY